MVLTALLGFTTHPIFPFPNAHAHGFAASNHRAKLSAAPFVPVALGHIGLIAFGLARMEATEKRSGAPPVSTFAVRPSLSVGSSRTPVMWTGTGTGNGVPIPEVTGKPAGSKPAVPVHAHPPPQDGIRVYSRLAAW